MRFLILQFFFLFQPELPLPFSYFENLCFESNSSPLLEEKKIPGTTLFLFESKETRTYLSHFFHLLEHLLGHWAYFGDQHFEEVRSIVLDVHENEWEGPNQINAHLLKALFPLAEIKTWEMFCQETGNKKICFEKALISDRAKSLASPECIKMNKMLGVARHSISQKALQHLADLVHSYAGTKIERSEVLRVTYLKRAPPRRIELLLEETLLSSIREIKGVSLRVEDFAELSFQEQIQTIGNTDCLISVHGNGLSHILFLPPTAQVIEIFPPHFYALDYCLFADLRGLVYTAIFPDEKVLNLKESYQLEPFGSADVAIDQLDIQAIVSRIRTPPIKQSDTLKGT